MGSTEEFQGQEKKILLISTVRSSPGFMDMDLKFNLGFVINPKVRVCTKYYCNVAWVEAKVMKVQCNTCRSDKFVL